MTVNESRRAKNRWVYALFGGLTLLMGGLAWRWWQNSPQFVVSRAANALQHHDIATLMQLTSREEIQRLHLSAEATGQYLNATLYRPGKIIDTALNEQQRIPPLADERGYVFGVEYPSPPGQRPVTNSVHLGAMRTPNGQWVLQHSLLLRACIRTLDSMKNASPLEKHHAYVELSAHYGITGYCTHNEIYINNQPPRLGSIFNYDKSIEYNRSSEQ